MRLQNSSIMRHRVEIWQNKKSDKPNRLGQYEIKPTLYGTAWAGIQPKTYTLLRGRMGDTELLNTTHLIYMRYRTDLTPDMWIMYNGQRYNITYIMDADYSHKRLELYCEVVL